MKYTLINRKKSIFAHNDAEFVNWMRHHDLQHWKNNQEFMEGYSFRKSTFEKFFLRFDSESHFVEDLIKFKLLKTEQRIKRTWNLLKQLSIRL